MTQSYNKMNREEQMKSILQRLPKKAPSDSFEEKLMANIRKIDAGEDVSLLGKNKSNWKVASLSTAAGLIIAFTLFNYNAENTTATKQKLQIANTTTKVESDSTKNKIKNFDRKLNLVGDQKKK